MNSRRRFIRPDLVIFDCDGVLVDSEMLACRAVSDSLRTLGIDMPVAEVVARYMGVSSKTMLNDLAARFEDKLSRNFPEIVQAKVRQAFEAGLTAIDDVEDVLRELSYPACVASSSALERIEFSLRLTGLLPYFSGHIFSSTMVTRGKPAPDLFLFAARQMGVSPPKCVVIEDSVPGVLGATAAGMRCVGFSGGAHCPPDHPQRLREAGAIMVTSHMSDLPTLLRGLG